MAGNRLVPTTSCAPKRIHPRTKAKQLWTWDLKAKAISNSVANALDAHLIRLTSKPELDVDRFQHTVDAKGNGCSIGYWRNTPRLVIRYNPRCSESTLSVTLKATTNTKNAIRVKYGQRGDNIGNPAHVAGLLHVFLWVVRSEKLLAITNQPATEGLRSYYTVMGFIDGERLDVASSTSLLRAFEFINATYRKENLSLVRSPP